MSGASTTVRVGADTADYMRKMQEVNRANRRAGGAMQQMGRSLARMAGPAAALGVASAAIRDSWLEINRRIERSTNLLATGAENAARLAAGVGAGPEGARALREMSPSVVSAFAERTDETADQAFQRMLASVRAFADAMPGGADADQLAFAADSVARARRAGIDDPNAFARILGEALTAGFTGQDAVDFATTAVTTGGRGAEAASRLLQQATQRGISGLEDTMRFMDSRQFRVGHRDVQATEALRSNLEGLEGALDRLAESADPVFQRQRAGIEELAEARFVRDRRGQDFAADRQELRLAQQVRREEQNLFTRQLQSLEDALVNFSVTLTGRVPSGELDFVRGTTPPRYVGSARDPEDEARDQ